MQHTSDYSIFKKATGNREVSQYKTEKLKASIATNNLLNLKPIIVNKEMEVIDGQHRLEAAKQLGVEVYYLVYDGDNSIMIELNKNQSEWSIEDYVLYYKQNGKCEYIKMCDFCKEHRISYSMFLVFCGIGRNKIRQAICSGNLVLPSEQKKQIIIKKIRCVQKIIDEFVMRSNDKTFVNLFCSFAFWDAIARIPEEVDIEIFSQRLCSHRLNIIRCNSYSLYLKQFVALDLYGRD